MVNATTETATRFYTACIIAETTEVAKHLQMPKAKPPDFATRTTSPTSQRYAKMLRTSWKLSYFRKQYQSKLTETFCTICLLPWFHSYDILTLLKALAQKSKTYHLRPSPILLKDLCYNALKFVQHLNLHTVSPGFAQPGSQVQQHDDLLQGSFTRRFVCLKETFKLKQYLPKLAEQKSRSSRQHYWI